VNVGKTLFAQIMEFVPWTNFARIVHRYDGNAGVRTLTCAEQLRAMAFAQLTWRESLRDIEASLAANASKLYAMGLRSPVKRSTLADANESRDWRIWLDLAAVLIRRVRKLYAGDTLVFLTNNTALPALTIAALYKSRWQVELFFKWIKQHLRIKKFLVTSENAVKTQFWCAVSTYVLIAIVKKELHLNAPLYTCLQILSVSVFEKTEISCALQPDDSAIELTTNADQLNLFNI